MLPVQLSQASGSIVFPGVRIAFSGTGGLPQPGSFLSDEELLFLNSLRLEKRRLEWQAGRLAAKKLIAGMSKKDMPSLAVSYDAMHRPVCGGFPVSITHSGGLAAAAYSESGIIGIDLEIIKPHSLRLAEDYFLEEEIPCTDAENIVMAWTRKEALLKALGLGLTVPAKSINAAGEKPVFFGKALERYKKLGSPDLRIMTARINGKGKEGWFFSVAAEI